MTNTTTKRALLTSVMALVLCFSMLLGTTYAWFTDSVTSAGNIIQSGTLNVEMTWKDATTNGAQQTYKDASEGAIFNYDKWEPGYVEAKNIKISNAGTLALKYQLAIVATGEVSKLADVIDVYYAEGEFTLVGREMTELTRIGTLTEVLAAISTTANGDLLKGETDTVTLALKMQETANNDYQELSIGSQFAIKCFATQLTFEKDSFDDQYDAMATIDSEAELLAALAANYDLISLGANVNVTNTIVIPTEKVVTIDLNGYSISQTNERQTTAYAMIDNQGTLTIEDSIGTGKISYTDTTPYTSDPGWASNTIKNTGTLTINGGTVENLTPEEVMNFGYPHAIDAYQGSVTTINGGTVKSLNYDSIRMFCNSETLATKVVINGGTIVNRISFQDPQSTRAGYGILEINGGNFVTINGVTANVRLLNFCKNCSNMKATVTGGTFDKGFKTQDIANSGIKTSDWLTMGTTVVATTDTELQDALANGGEIALVSDVTITTTLRIPATANTTLNLNGYNLSYAVANNGAAAIINNSGTLKIVGEGTISFVAENPDLQEIPAYATNTITNTGSLTIGEGVTVTNNSDGGASYAVDNHGTFVLDGGTLIGNRCALRIARYNQDNVSFVMNSGLVQAETPAWIQLPGSSSAAAPKITVEINGGTLQSTKPSSDANDVIYTYSFGNSHANTSITINGGEFLGGVVSIGAGYKGDVPTLTINGGTFEYDVLQWLANNGTNILYNANK